jgi:F-type H+-transporting ATPase subunit epsilon
MAKIQLDIVTPERQAFTEEVDAVYAPTATGTIGILAHHVPLFCTLTEGEIKIESGNKEYFLAIGGGFMEVDGKKVSILVSRAQHADEINETEIKKAQALAREAIGRRVKGLELEEAQAILRRSLIEFKVLRRRTHRITNIPGQ